MNIWDGYRGEEDDFMTEKEIREEAGRRGAAFATQLAEKYKEAIQQVFRDALVKERLEMWRHSPY